MLAWVVCTREQPYRNLQSVETTIGPMLAQAGPILLTPAAVHNPHHSIPLPLPLPLPLPVPLRLPVSLPVPLPVRLPFTLALNLPLALPLFLILTLTPNSQPLQGIRPELPDGDDWRDSTTAGLATLIEP